MKYLSLPSSIPSVVVWLVRWRGPFRSHAGFAILGLVLIVILVVLIFGLMRDRQDTGSAEVKNEGPSK